jgi:hypothetical protein
MQQVIIGLSAVIEGVNGLRGRLSLSCKEAMSILVMNQYSPNSSGLDVYPIIARQTGLLWKIKTR